MSMERVHKKYGWNMYRDLLFDIRGAMEAECIDYQTARADMVVYAPTSWLFNPKAHYGPEWKIADQFTFHDIPIEFRDSGPYGIFVPTMLKLYELEVLKDA